MWAITTRLNPATGIMRGTGTRGLDNFPTEKGATTSESTFEGGIGLDCTAPFDLKWRFMVGKYSVDRVDLKKWFSEEEIAAVRAQQSEYAKLLAERGQ